MSPASTRGNGRGLYGATRVSVRGDYGEDGWMPSGDEAPLSQCFFAMVVSAVVSSVELSSSGWMKITVGQTLALISSSETS